VKNCFVFSHVRITDPGTRLQRQREHVWYVESRRKPFVIVWQGLSMIPRPSVRNVRTGISRIPSSVSQSNHPFPFNARLSREIRCLHPCYSPHAGAHLASAHTQTHRSPVSWTQTRLTDCVKYCPASWKRVIEAADDAVVHPDPFSWRDLRGLVLGGGMGVVERTFSLLLRHESLSTSRISIAIKTACQA
jgi:hypothetical protein